MRYTKRLFFVGIAALPLVAGRVRAQAPTALTPDALLDVRTITIGDWSADGRYLSLRVSTRRDGLGFVAARDGDPSYTRPAPSELLIVDVAKGDTLRPFRGTRTLGTMTWARRGAVLAIATRDSVPELHTFDATARRLTRVSLGGARLAETSDVQWTDDGRLAVAVREGGWLPDVRARFDSLVRGPVSVQVATDSFLSWDALRRLGARAMVVRVTPGRPGLDTLVLPTQLIGWNMTADGNTVTWREDRTSHTTYESFQPIESRLWSRSGRDAPRVLLASLKGASGFAASDDGRHYAFARDGAVYVGSVADSAPRRVIGPAPRARGDSAAAGGRDTTTRYALSRLSPTGTMVIVAARGSLTLVDVARARTVPLHVARDTVSGPRVAVADWSTNGNTLLLTASSRTTWDRAVIRWDADGMGADTLVRDGRLYGAVRASPDASRIALLASSAGRPADLHVTDGRLTRSAPALLSNPQWTGRALPTTELVRYLDADGRPQFGVLMRPAGATGPLPTVFAVYEEFFDDTYDATAMYLASHGYAVLKPSVTFETGFPGEAWLKGVTAAANALIERGIADSAHLGVHGTSYGGYATNLLITQTARFKAAINISGKVDIISFYTDSPRLGVRNVNAAERTQDRIGATLWEQPQKYVAHSAVMFADRIRTPLLLMTGGEDHNVPAINTREMYYALRRLGRTVEWVNYTNGGHGIPMTTASEFADWHTRLLGWYDRWLRPKEAMRPKTSG
ncbi:MAG: prolyl oligopeptidase family serine peptidase [Gemmatimonadaceae bacterium]|jgi:dipeptidyl aminopeptidase/acylaminoacyl peptidase|nr:prolyl oligopeptidase family serine peptidase [Gemmatimonadaceae bacterium]